ncbi:Uu.00g083580.m01.CDS01 [Anthostomella pinea]|uniref:Uu.00g083580.m01.CDS01 n=1 Tax=Anthostomella pinea TaxID=933095 RepID=A0AAI8YJN0_9PEZI|nr:Uu.00g083580.m01.CDS01 [Anthostomella pinea]
MATTPRTQPEGTQGTELMLNACEVEILAKVWPTSHPAAAVLPLSPVRTSRSDADARTLSPRCLRTIKKQMLDVDASAAAAAIAAAT